MAKEDYTTSDADLAAFTEQKLLAMQRLRPEIELSVQTFGLKVTIAVLADEVAVLAHRVGRLSRQEFEAFMARSFVFVERMNNRRAERAKRRRDGN